MQEKAEKKRTRIIPEVERVEIMTDLEGTREEGAETRQKTREGSTVTAWTYRRSSGELLNTK